MPKSAHTRFALVPATLALLVAACGSPAPELPALVEAPPAPEQSAADPAPVVVQPTEALPPAPEQAAVEEQPVVEPPAEVVAPPPTPDNRSLWQTATYTDVRTGEGFTLDHYAGKVVVVELMAVWCPKCLSQQQQLSSALAQLNTDQVVAVSLDVDPGETADLLASYAASHAFSWRYAVAGPDVSTSLQADFGPEALSPPSTPIIIVGPDGSYEKAPPGIKNVPTLIELVQARLT